MRHGNASSKNENMARKKETRKKELEKRMGRRNGREKYEKWNTRKNSTSQAYL